MTRGSLPRDAGQSAGVHWGLTTRAVKAPGALGPLSSGIRVYKQPSWLPPRLFNYYCHLQLYSTVAGAFLINYCEIDYREAYVYFIIKRIPTVQKGDTLQFYTSGLCVVASVNKVTCVWVIVDLRGTSRVVQKPTDRRRLEEREETTGRWLCVSAYHLGPQEDS